MGQVQEQRYTCKICYKSCVSGKSLGGHMRVHLAPISASKKAAQVKVESKMEFEGGDDQSGSFQLKESSKNQSNSAVPSEEKIKNWNSNVDFGDGDQNNCYGLRENPKKSWRISDSKCSVSKKVASCKECGKEFPSLRALSGHSRSHSIKNGGVHQCKKCGKSFNSMRAMFGHMKSHSKKSRVPDESWESLSDLENFCPIRRKRSRIRYKITPNPSFSSMNESNSAVSELGEVEEVAVCLMMLSRGVTYWDRFKSVRESSIDDSVYFGAESSFRSNKVAGKEVSESDDLDSRFAAENDMRVEFEVSEDLLLGVDNEINVDLEVSDDGLPGVDKCEQLTESAVEHDCCDDGSTKFTELDKDLLVPIGMNKTKSIHFKTNSSENAACKSEILKDFDEKGEYKCRTCGKIFHSHQALGGHNAWHKMQGNGSSVDAITSMLSVTESGSKLDQRDYSDIQLEQANARVVGITSLESSKSKEHECSICFKVFPSGQALGSHKRAHYTGVLESKANETSSLTQETADIHNLFDLNFPMNVDEGTISDVGLNLWWVESQQEQEALILTS